MPNPLFNALGGNKIQGNLGSFQNMMQAFKKFRDGFQGDPKAEVEKLLQSGRMSQEQLNRLQQAAQMFQNVLGGM